jgi:uncharacterized protein (TIGR00297 family)
MFPFQVVAGFFLGTVISVVALKSNALTRDGAFAAALLGTLIFGLGGLPWAVLLLTFFITSSGLSRVLLGRKMDTAEIFSKGSRRDWGQVVANGGLGAVLILIQISLPEESWPWWAYAGALAAVNADTWATELGILSTTPPRIITTGKITEKGASGGVTLAGTLAAVIGSTVIGVAAGFFPDLAGTSTVFQMSTFIGTISISGLAGAFIDSLLGATFQTIYYCPTCEKETEHPFRHTCGTPTKHIRGFSWLNNDGVNFIASLVGAGMAALIGVNF